MKKKTRNAIRGAQPTTQRGSMMIEVLVSVVLLSISVLGLVRVLGQSMKDSGELEYRSVASTIADEWVGRMWVDPTNLEAYATADPVDLPPEVLPGATRMITVNGNRVTIAITWQAPGTTSPSRHQMSATIARNPAP